MDEDPAVPTARGPAARLSGALALVGAALIAAGATLTWARVAGGGTSVTVRWPVGYRALFLLCSALALLAGLAMLMARERRGTAVLAIVGGAMACGTGVWVAAFGRGRLLDDAAGNLAARFGGTPERVRALIEQAIEAGWLQISMRSGPFLVILGGALCGLGGIVLLVGVSRGGRSAVPAMALPPAPTPPSVVHGGRSAPEPAREGAAEGDAITLPGG